MHKLINAILANAGELPEPLARLYAAAGVPVGQKIPMNKIDAAFAKMDMTIQARMRLKSQLHSLGVIVR
jgi:hypothetical protein